MKGCVTLAQLGDLPPMLTVEDAAGLIGISRGSAYAAVRSGELPAVRIGRRWLIPTTRLLQEILGVVHDASASAGGSGREAEAAAVTVEFTTTSNSAMPPGASPS